MGRLTVVGFGPGGYEDMTNRAVKVIEEAEMVIGYTTYVELLKPLFPEKEYIATPMMQEIKRCEMAVELAGQYDHIAMVSSGDSGIYGMAGIVMEVAQKKHANIEIQVVPGITAASAAAAILGAPLMHDFAVISLSDLLTPWDRIQKRIEMAAQGDFVTALYNPKSKKRVQNIEEVRRIMLQYRNPDTPVGIVTAASRDGEQKVISTLADFTKEAINMFSLVIIGNSQTYVRDGWMITPRGYQNKEGGI